MILTLNFQGVIAMFPGINCLPQNEKQIYQLNTYASDFDLGHYFDIFFLAATKQLWEHFCPSMTYLYKGPLGLGFVQATGAH